MIIIAFCTLAVALFFLIEGGRGIVHGLRSVNWPITTAEVISSEIVELSSAGGSSMYKSVIYFEYEVDGLTVQNCDGSVALNQQESLSWGKANAVVKKYPVGKKIDICYYPKRRDVACVASEAGLSLAPFVMVTASSLFLYLGLIILKMSTPIG